MMFGFGDAERPCTATVELIDGILTDYMRTLVRMRPILATSCMLAPMSSPPVTFAMRSSSAPSLRGRSPAGAPFFYLRPRRRRRSRSARRRVR